MSRIGTVPPAAVGLTLYRIAAERLIACEPVRFVGGCGAVDTVLRRAAIAGRVEIGGELQDHFADLLDDKQDILETVALDADSYRSLKTRWAKCKLEPVQ